MVGERGAYEDVNSQGRVSLSPLPKLKGGPYRTHQAVKIPFHDKMWPMYQSLCTSPPFFNLECFILMLLSKILI